MSEPPAGDVRRSPRPGRIPRRRRSAWKIVLIAVAVVLALVLGAAAIVYVRLDQKIQTFDPHGLSPHRPPPSVAGQNILLIGSDSRNGGTDTSLGGRGDAVGRSDTTLLVHIYEGGKRAVAVSIPRDALVDIPRCLLPNGSWSAPQPHAQFNLAFSVGQTRSGNPACTVNTVEKLTHMRIDHTVVADFAGFAAMTKIVGGVPVCLPNAVYQGDLNPNLHQRGKLLFHAGVQTVSGAKALAYVRIRHGIGDGSDIGRMRRQQAFLSSVIAKVRADGLTPTHILPLAEAAVANLTVDSGLDSPRKLMSLVLSLRDLTPQNITFVTTPWQYDGPRVALVHPDVDRLWKALRTDQPIGPDQGQNAQRVTVRQTLAKVKAPVTVVDAAAQPAVGRRTAARLRALGVHVAGEVSGSTHPRTTVVVYGHGAGGAARDLAAAFPGSRLRRGHVDGLHLVLGAQDRMLSPGAVAVPPRVKLPASITSGSRTASENPCKGVSYGAGSAP